MNREHWKSLVDLRLSEAKALLNAKQWSGAYYLSGYAVECGLKACILRRVEETGIIFVERKFGEKCWTHSIQELVLLADLHEKLEQETETNGKLKNNWETAEEWDELSRYAVWSHLEAKALFKAITTLDHGVLSWIKNHW